jgi:hypothetical protein
MTDLESPQPSTRVEREILEILERADAKPTPVQDLQSAFRNQSVSAKARMPRMPSLNLSPGLYRIGAALILAIAAAGVSGISHLGGLILAVLSLAVFFSLWFASRGPGGGGGPQRWRGQDLNAPGPWPQRGFDRGRPRRLPRWPLR